MKTLFRRIQLDDECPRLGSGARFVTVQIGRKWVYLRMVAQPEKRARVSLATWERITSKRG